MKLTKAQKGLETRLGHRFATPALLVEALTHGSVTVQPHRDNQRLEFLGDRVLGLVTAEALLAQDKAAREGQLAPRFNALVRKETCCAVAQEIGLGEALLLGRSESQSGGRRKQALLADAMEAVIAAVYLDAGFDAARRVILALWEPWLAGAESVTHDAKTALQEWAQARGFPTPVYTDIARTGPDHQPAFEVEVTIESGEAARATASSKRAAQQQAAEALLGRLGAEA